MSFRTSSCDFKILTTDSPYPKAMEREISMMVIKVHAISHRKSFTVINIIEQTGRIAQSRCYKENKYNQDDDMPKSIHLKISNIVVISQIGESECKQNKTKPT